MKISKTFQMDGAIISATIEDDTVRVAHENAGLLADLLEKVMEGVQDKEEGQSR